MSRVFFYFLCLVIYTKSKPKKMEDAVLLSICTLAAAAFAALLRVLYKSKCTKIDCWCIKVERDVAGEEKYDEEHGHGRSSISLGLGGGHENNR